VYCGAAVTEARKAPNRTRMAVVVVRFFIFFLFSDVRRAVGFLFLFSEGDYGTGVFVGVAVLFAFLGCLVVVMMKMEKKSRRRTEKGLTYTLGKRGCWGGMGTFQPRSNLPRCQAQRKVPSTCK
jgi:hypothetical protein